jgi:hypothetical protein
MKSVLTGRSPQNGIVFKRLWYASKSMGGSDDRIVLWTQKATLLCRSQPRFLCPDSILPRGHRDIGPQRDTWRRPFANHWRSRLGQNDLRDEDRSEAQWLDASRAAFQFTGMHQTCIAAIDFVPPWA